jgi:rubrerythrin
MDCDLAGFYRELLATPEGQAHALTLQVYAEEGDEGAILDQLVERVEEPRLNRLVRQHRDDEVRHAELFRGCLTRLGLDPQPLPDELRVIRHLAQKVGGFAVALDSVDEWVIAGVYALLLATEERGIEVYTVIADAFASVDPETAETYGRIIRDEMRHTRYCRTIGRKYAVSDDAWDGLVDATKMVEAEAFAEFQAANVTYCMDEGLLSNRPTEGRRGGQQESWA